MFGAARAGSFWDVFFVILVSFVDVVRVLVFDFSYFPRRFFGFVGGGILDDFGFFFLSFWDVLLVLWGVFLFFMPF